MEERASVSTKEVRRLLDEVLPTLNDLRAFVMDELGKQEYQRIEGIQNRVQFVNELLACHADALNEIVTALERWRAPRPQQSKRSTIRVLLGLVIVGSLLLGAALLAIQLGPKTVDGPPQLRIIAMDQGVASTDLAKRSEPPVVDLGAASPPSRRGPRRPPRADMSAPSIPPLTVSVGEPSKPLPTSCGPDSIYYGELTSHGLSPCVQKPRIAPGTSCSCEVGMVGKRCLLAGFADVVGKNHFGGLEEQIRQNYREDGTDRCDNLLNHACRQTKDDGERYLCYCCPE